MALNTNNEIINGQSGIVVQGTAVAGGYFVSQSIEITTTGEPGKIPDYACVTGALCYCTSDSKIYQYNGSKWIEKQFGALLGTDANSAFPGDKGQQAFEHATTSDTNPHNTTAEDLGLGKLEKALSKSNVNDIIFCAGTAEGLMEE